MSISLVIFKICVIPLTLSSLKLAAFHSDPRNRKSSICELFSISPMTVNISPSIYFLYFFKSNDNAAFTFIRDSILFCLLYYDLSVILLSAFGINNVPDQTKKTLFYTLFMSQIMTFTLIQFYKNKNF